MSTRRVGRYVMHDPIASGGMATVHLGRMLGPAGFSRTVAIKRLHPHLARDPEFVSMFLDEARLAARVQHPNVVATLDIVATDGELFLVMEYILGESLSVLIRRAKELAAPIPLSVVSSVMSGVLSGLHAIHEARNEQGDSLQIVHRDISPQNILVGADGVARVVDFGVAKAAFRIQSTQGDQIKGKVAYMAPEQLMRGAVDRRADLYAAAVVLWESLTSQRLFTAGDPGALVAAVLEGCTLPPSKLRAGVPADIDAIVLKAIDRHPESRFATALEFLVALQAVVSPAPPHDISAWVGGLVGASLDVRRQMVATVEQTPAESTASDESSLPRLLPGPRTYDEAHALADAPTAQLAALDAQSSRRSVEGGAWAAQQRKRQSRAARFGLSLLAVLFASAAGYGLWQGHGTSPSNTSTPPVLTAVLTAMAASTSTASVPTPLAASSASETPAAGAVAPAPSPTVASVTAPSVAPTGSVPPNRSRPVARSAPSAQPQATATAQASAPSVASAPSSAPEDCNPPFVLEPNGVKRFKRSCF